MPFERDLRKFIEEVNERQFKLRTDIGEALLLSITQGSEVTGAPGQPVDTGNLRNSWQITRPEPHVTVVSTPVVYAPGIEDGVQYLQDGGSRSITLRSEVGGFHSVKMTLAAFQKVVNRGIQELET